MQKFSNLLNWLKLTQIYLWVSFKLYTQTLLSLLLLKPYFYAYVKCNTLLDHPLTLEERNKKCKFFFWKENKNVSVAVIILKIIYQT